MSKTTTRIDFGEILEVLENGLTFFSIKLENAVEKKLGRFYKKDTISFAIKKSEKERKKQNKELAKQQDFQLEYSDRVQKTEAVVKHEQTTQRLQEIENNEQDQSQDAELDRE